VALASHVWVALAFSVRLRTLLSEMNQSRPPEKSQFCYKALRFHRVGLEPGLARNVLLVRALEI
jgi:hypothetical protein